jgi:hypothetical protein
MRKHQQRQILELLQTIVQAQSMGMYANCQKGAQGLVEFIEQIEGEGTQTVALLVEYYELLFRANEGEIGEKPLREHLVQIESSVRSELKPNKIEIAFLSYNASMSDSIESIYLAAKADPDCDAYWIPIPYFERKSDGSFGTMRHEGADHYSDGIECTDWRQYDIEARHPDAVFTFAPYDSENYVTSVHPVFYCERLRNLTDLLVYIPYFVALGEVQKHFCIVAGCVFAHKVVLQSEEIRDIYVRAFKEAYGDGFGKPEDKFVALGSPKFDRVVNTKREDCEVPAEWARIIEGKRVVLYNTSVGAILQYGKQYLKKLRSVLETFCNRDDVVPWWRPHPLSDATFLSMRPDLLEEYQEIVREYRYGGNGELAAICKGIYDDTPDLHRAIAWSDGYYGDMSSLVALYQVTEKPLLIQDVFQTHNNRILFNFLCRDENKWYTVLNTTNSLVTIDKRSSRIEYVSSSLRSCRGIRPKQSLYNDAVIVERKIYFAPFATDVVDCFDITSGEWSSIKVVLPVNSDYNYLRAAKIIAFRNYIYLFPVDMVPVIIKINTNTNEVSYLQDWYREIKPYDAVNTMFGYRLGYFPHFCAIIGNVVFAPLKNIPAVMLFDLESEKAMVYRTNLLESGFSASCYGGGYYWLASISENKLLRFDPKNGKFNNYDVKCDGLRFGYIPFNNVIFWNGRIYLVPNLCNDVVVFDVNTEKFVRMSKPDNGNENASVTESKFNYSLLDGDTLITHNWSGLSKYSLSNNEVCHTVLDMDKNERMKILCGLNFDIKESSLCSSQDDNIVFESDFTDLEYFLNHLGVPADNTALRKTVAGLSIYRYVKKEVLNR